jgi:membrane-associated protein
MHFSLFNTTAFLFTAGYLGLFALVFAETGLLIGLILPGETLVFTAGFLSSLGYFNIFVVMAIVFCAAVLADSAEYGFGKKYGAKVFDKRNSLFFDKEYVDEAESFYKKHGGQTIFLSRFLPFIRTLAPLFAGIGNMRYSSFVTYNVTGALAWSVSISSLGYFLGKILPNPDQYAVWLVVGIAVILLMSPLLALLQSKRRRQRLWTFLGERLGQKRL